MNPIVCTIDITIKAVGDPSPEDMKKAYDTILRNSPWILYSLEDKLVDRLCDLDLPFDLKKVEATLI